MTDAVVVKRFVGEEKGGRKSGSADGKRKLLSASQQKQMAGIKMHAVCAGDAISNGEQRHWLGAQLPVSVVGSVGSDWGILGGRLACRD